MRTVSQRLDQPPAEVSPLDLPVGFVIDGRYRVLSRLGCGGVASVFEAERVPLGSRVAVKVIHPSWARVAEVRERFRREVAALAAIDSPHVVAILGAGRVETVHGELPYLVMELVEGRTIADLLADGPLAIARAVRLAALALEALGEAHAQGVIHRDVKPENLVVTPPPTGALLRGPRIKLIDFGLSRSLAEVAPGRITRVGFTVGTPSYMAPEQALADARADHRIDLFAMGVTLYEMLTGRTPFDGPSSTVILSRILGQAAAPPSALCPAIGAALDAVVLRALEKDPARRFSDAEAFRAALLASIAPAASCG